MKKAVLMLMAVIVAIGAFTLATGSVEARPNYKKEWDAKYLMPGSPMAKALPAGKSNCNLCHQGTKDKKTRNEYGKALGKLINKEMDAEKIKTALSKVESEKVGDKTFGELIKEGKLPLTPQEP